MLCLDQLLCVIYELTLRILMVVENNVIQFERRGSVVVSTSAWHVGGPSSMPGHDRHGIVGVKTWLSTLGTAVSRDSDNQFVT